MLAAATRSRCPENAQCGQVLHHGALVGKVDASADRKASVLQVDAVHEDVPFTAAMAQAVRAELAALAGWLGLAAVVPAGGVVGVRRG